MKIGDLVRPNEKDTDDYTYSPGLTGVVLGIKSKPPLEKYAVIAWNDNKLTGEYLENLEVLT